MNVGDSVSLLPPYSITAALYDRLIGRFAFEQWRENFDRLSRRYGFDLSCCADVACGTGLASRYLAAEGAAVFAVDRSLPMLRTAAAAVRGMRVTLLRQDMRWLYLPRRVGAIICATDSLNHLLREKDVIRTLRSFYLNLEPGGYALFDMNTCRQLREGGDTEPWDFEVDGEPMKWISEWDEGRWIATLRLIFPQRRGMGGLPLCEVHRERAYEERWIKRELEEAGFETVAVLDAAGLGKVGDRTRRIQFAAQKVV